MTKARYLIRFDDLCPTMDWQAWEGIEVILNELGIKPILAVVPDNQDEKLVISKPRPDFWDKVRGWQKAGWTVCLHGYQHKMVNESLGMLGISRGSEFAGLSYEEQRRKISSGLEIFRREGVRASAWVAPRHSFDETTLMVLREFNVSTVSDGFSVFPFRDENGTLWIPQQFWRLRPVPFGVWTVCVHPNRWKKRDLDAFAGDIKRFRDQITHFDEVVDEFADRVKSWSDAGFSRLLFAAFQAKKKARNLLPPTAVRSA